MSSEILNQLGLDPAILVVILAALVLILTIVVIVMVVRMGRSIAVTIFSCEARTLRHWKIRSPRFTRPCTSFRMKIWRIAM